MFEPVATLYQVQRKISECECRRPSQCELRSKQSPTRRRNNNIPKLLNILKCEYNFEIFTKSCCHSTNCRKNQKILTRLFFILVIVSVCCRMNTRSFSEIRLSFSGSFLTKNNQTADHIIHAKPRIVISAFHL